MRSDVWSVSAIAANVATVAEAGWYTISETADILGAKYDTVQKRANRYMRGHPESPLVSDADPGVNGGKRSVLLSSDLVGQWTESVPLAGSTARERFLSEKLLETTDMLRQEREKRFADMEAKVADLEATLAGREMELAAARSQLRAVGQVVAQLTS